MTNGDLTNWITSGLEKGISRDELAKRLKEAGYTDDKIAAAFEDAGKPGSGAEVKAKRNLLPGLIAAGVVAAIAMVLVLNPGLFSGGDRAAPQADDVRAAASFQEGLDTFNTGNYSAAETLFREATETDPGDIYAHLNLGSALEEQGKFEEAEVAYAQAKMLDPTNSYVFIYLGVLYLKQGKLTDAEEAFAAARQLEPTSPYGHFGLARVHQERGELEAAREQIALGKDLATEQQLALVLEDMPELAPLME